MIKQKGARSRVTLHRDEHLFFTTSFRVRKRRDAGSDDFEGLLEFQQALNVGWKLFLDGRSKFGGIYVGRMGFG